MPTNGGKAKQEEKPGRQRDHTATPDQIPRSGEDNVTGPDDLRVAAAWRLLPTRERSDHGLWTVPEAGALIAGSLLAQVADVAESRVEEVLELVGLAADGGRRVGGYSMGMRQRLSLASALLRRISPDDDPRSIEERSRPGLDLAPWVRVRAWRHERNKMLRPQAGSGGQSHEDEGRRRALSDRQHGPIRTEPKEVFMAQSQDPPALQPRDRTSRSSAWMEGA
jgi:hypothetical protein